MSGRHRLFALGMLLIPLSTCAQKPRAPDDDLVVHGTINIALGNKNGLVVLTDSMVTSGNRQLADPAQKLFKLDDQTVCAIAGFGWASSPEVPDLNTSSAAIVYEYVRQSAAQTPQRFLEKVRTLAVLFKMNLSMIANVLKATGHPVPPQVFAFQMIVAGYDIDGKPKMAKVNLGTTAPNMLSEVEEGVVVNIEDDLICKLNGIPDVAAFLLSHPDSIPQDPVLSQYASAHRANNGRSLTVEQMTALAERLAFYTSREHPEVGGPNQVAVITAPHMLKVTQPPFGKPAKALLEFSLLVDADFSYSSIELTAPHSVFIRCRWIGMRREIGGNFFVGNTFADSVLTYQGGTVSLGPTNQITDSVLLVGGLIRPDDDVVLRLSRAFRWKAILRDFSSGAVSFY